MMKKVLAALLVLGLNTHAYAQVIEFDAPQTAPDGSTRTAPQRVSVGEPLPVAIISGTVTVDSEADITAVDGAPLVDGELPVHDADLLAAMAAEVPAGDELIGGVDIRASTLGGLTKYTLTAANSTNATNIKASAGKLYHITGYNNSATLAWISFYNTAETPTCGTGIVWQTMIPANSTSGSGAIDDIPAGLDFSTGIGICVTTGIAGTGSVAASTYVVNLGYK